MTRQRASDAAPAEAAGHNKLRDVRRLVIFTGDVSLYSVRKGIAELRRRFPDMGILVVEHRRARSTKRLLRNQRRNLRKHGWRWIPYQARDLVSRWLAARPYDVSGLGRRPGEQFDLRAVLSGSEIHLISAGIHSDETIEEVRGFGPDLGFSLAAPILKPEIFEVPRLGTLNLHKGRLPEYRGMPPAFWELWNDEHQVGCTIHKVDRSLDTGPILLEQRIPRRKYSTVRGLQIDSG